jgi:hypothetical protein
MAALEARLPPRYWIEINALLVREAHLHRAAAEVLDLSGAGHVPAGGGDGASVGHFDDVSLPAEVRRTGGKRLTAAEQHPPRRIPCNRRGPWRRRLQPSRPMKPVKR